MILDLFAGAGGWDVGARMAGYDGPLVGIEWDGPACRTAVAAGHERIQADIATYPTRPFVGKVDGLIASPPCQSWSSAGKRGGFNDPRGPLSHEPLRWACALRPRWIALEQVPEVLPLWQHVAHELRKLGYSTWTGMLCAANYGVPQERYRALLVGRRDTFACAPVATHAESPNAGLFGDVPQWVTMAEALGIGAGWSYDSGQNSKAAGGGTERYWRSCDRPAGTVTGKTTHQWVLWRDNERLKLTSEDSLTLQGFSRKFPVLGTGAAQAQQVGNAVPPPLASAVVGPLLASASAVAA